MRARVILNNNYFLLYLGQPSSSQERQLSEGQTTFKCIYVNVSTNLIADVTDPTSGTLTI